mgnify:CR=1 FL=1
MGCGNTISTLADCMLPNLLMGFKLNDLGKLLGLLISIKIS